MERLLHQWTLSFFPPFFNRPVLKAMSKGLKNIFLNCVYLADVEIEMREVFKLFDDWKRLNDILVL